MNAVLRPLPPGEGGGEGQRVAEPSPKYLAQLERPLIRSFDLLAGSPGGVAKLRELILTLAVQGKLVPQNPSDEPASVLLQKIRVEKDRLIAEGKIKRDKPLVEIAEEEKPFALARGWEWARFGETSINRDGERIPVSSNDRESRAKIYDYYGASGVIDRIDRFLFDKTLLLVGEDGANLINRSTPIAFLAHGKYWVNNHAHVVDTTHPGLMNYLALFINAVSLESYVTGTAQPKMNQAKLNSIPVALPPLAEQSRIVTRVKELMRLCDALEAKGQLEAEEHAQLVSTLLGTLTESDTPEALADNWQRIATHFDLLLDRPEAVDILEQTILQLAVRGLLVPQDPLDEPAGALLGKIRAEKDELIAVGKIKREKTLTATAEEEKPFELPQGWEWVCMGNLVNASEAGWSPTCIGSPRHKGSWGVLKVSAVSWGTFDPNANKELPANLSPRPEYEVKDGDFLLSRANTEELVARSVVVDKTEPRLMLSDKIIRLDVSRHMNRVFLNICNNASHSRVYYAANASGTSSSMKNVSREVVLRTPVPLPPLAEQSRIVARVESLRRLCADLRQRLTASQTTQARLADALVTQTG
jgi:type I restriction enzyme, S subunit